MGNLPHVHVVLQATVSGGVTDVTYGNCCGSADKYSETDNLNSAVATSNDTLNGGDAWSNSDNGTYHQNADGTSTGSNTTSATSSGNDLYTSRSRLPGATCFHRRERIKSAV